MDNELIKIYQTSNTIKVYTFVSIIFNLFNLLITHIYLVDLFIYALGYYGAKFYSKANLYMFYVFLILLSAVKFISISYMYFTTDLMAMNKNNIINLNFDVAISLLSFMINIYISRFGYRLYHLLNNSSDQVLNTLRMNQPIITPLSLW